MNSIEATTLASTLVARWQLNIHAQRVCASLSAPPPTRSAVAEIRTYCLHRYPLSNAQTINQQVCYNNRLVVLLRRAYFTLRSMPTDDKLAFSKRLKLALKRSHKKIATPTELALQFNLRHSNESVSAQAAQKWLSGKAKPTQDKIATLADWLSVSEHWLNYGNSKGEQIVTTTLKGKSHANSNAGLSETESELIANYRRLSPHQQTLVSDLVEQLAAEWKA